MSKLAIPGVLSIIFVLLNVAVIAIILTQFTEMLALSSVLLIVMLIIVISRIEMKGSMLKERLRRRKMQDATVDGLENIANKVEDMSVVFKTKTDEMYDKMHTNIDMQRRVWTHDFEIKHRDLKDKVTKIEEDISRLKRVSE